MKNAIILHGKPSKEEYYDPTKPSMSNAHWIPWLQGQLLKNDIWAATPEVPVAHDPQWELWDKEVERFDITPETILVGHSCGGGFWIKWLSLHPDVSVGKVVLVAPSLAKGWDSKDFFKDFKIDSNMATRTQGITIFNSTDDNEGIQESVKDIRDAITGVEYKEFTGYGHFTSRSMGKLEFPELLEEVIA